MLVPQSTASSLRAPLRVGTIEQQGTEVPMGVWGFSARSRHQDIRSAARLRGVRSWAEKMKSGLLCTGCHPRCPGLKCELSASFTDSDWENTEQANGFFRTMIYETKKSRHCAAMKQLCVPHAAVPCCNPCGGRSPFKEDGLRVKNCDRHVCKVGAQMCDHTRGSLEACVSDVLLLPIIMFCWKFLALALLGLVVSVFIAVAENLILLDTARAPPL